MSFPAPCGRVAGRKLLLAEAVDLSYFRCVLIISFHQVESDGISTISNGVEALVLVGMSHLKTGEDSGRSVGDRDNGHHGFFIVSDSGCAGHYDLLPSCDGDEVAGVACGNSYFSF